MNKLTSTADGYKFFDRDFRGTMSAFFRRPGAGISLMKHCVTSVLLISLTLVACRPRDESAVAVEITRQVTAPAAMIVTPTPVPTRVPTVVRVKPTAIPSATQVITPETDNKINFSAGDKCDEILKKLYTRAGDLCLSGPTGYFCNGGQASKTEPDAGSLNAPGAMADADTLDSLQTAQLGTEHGGGLIWLRLEENIRMDALLIGQVNMQNVVRDASGLRQMAVLHHRKRDSPIEL